MQDSLKRQINYLRISITDRCNLRCVYCMPPQGVQCIPHREILTIEEILKVVQAATRVGISKVRLTGGEPLLRRGLLNLIRGISQTARIEDIALTTNGLLLEKKAADLKAAGLKRVNISLDTLDAHLYRSITRGGDFNLAWRGVLAALKEGLHPVKINTVAVRGLNHGELVDLARLTLSYPLHVRFIELMPVGASNAGCDEKYMAAAEIAQLITDRLGRLARQEQHIVGAGPASYGVLPGALGSIGFISAISDHFCARCNRLRLTSTGQLRPCLFSRHEIDLKQLLRGGAGADELVPVLQQAIKEKPGQHHLENCWPRDDRVMSQIGG